MAHRLNPDAHAAVQAARDGRCKDAMKYLYDASPHMQASCGSENFERAVSDYRHASVIVAGSCALPQVKRSKRIMPGGFDGSRKRKRK